MPNEPMTVTVSQLNRKISYMFRGESSFADICVRGEVSDLRKNEKSGHYYLKLGDEGASVSAIIYSWNKDAAAGLENGTEIIARGKVSVYEPYGTYSLQIASVQTDGIGALSDAFEKLKIKLGEEGLFEQKRDIPASPSHICVITSETGAVLQDIRNVLSRRCPQVRVTLIPAAVQGDNAPASIVSAFRIADTLDCDTVIFGRGGGSSDDLSAFNNEAVVRAIYASKAPTISAVGHETDFTLADFAADKRAPTPSAAAELAVRDNRERMAELTEKLYSIDRALHRLIDVKLTAVNYAEREIKLKSPEMRLVDERLRLDTVSGRIKDRLDTLIESKERAFLGKTAVIEALNPLAVLLRGYSITYSGERAVKSADELSPGDTVKIRLYEGSVTAEVKETGK
ncbi:MAG: exodeoxyribonuclease VII large subunit [Ruminiclostridium sp.]|nr:exodeoxyribonuclease VII large subunit [Ruminiclostridium sp.]